MKRPSEAEFGAALRGCDLSPVVHKPPDDARNMKPCDFMAWWSAQSQYGPGYDVKSAWFECKDTDAAGVFTLSQIRPSQRAGILEAQAIGLPYYLAVYWRKRRVWTISNAARILEQVADAARNMAVERGLPDVYYKTGVTFAALAGDVGIDAKPHLLSSTLAEILRGKLL